MTFWFFSALKTADAVINFGVRFFGLMISRQPEFVNHIRLMYRQVASVTAYPTKKGLDVLTDASPVWPMRYLKEKPIREFEGEQFLTLYQAKKDGLIEMHFNVGETTETSFDTVFDTLFEFMEGDENDPYIAWGKLRTRGMQTALREYIFPHLEKETTEVLIREAQTEVLRQCQIAYGERIRVAGYAKTFAYEEDDVGVGSTSGKDTRIFAIAYSSEPGLAAYGVVVDHLGDVVDTVRLPNFVDRQRMNDKNCPKKRDLNIIAQLILKRRPHIIVVAAENLEAERLVNEVKSVIRNMADAGDIPQTIPVDVYRNDIAKVYSLSKTAKNDFPDYGIIQKQAVSLARMVADPLVEVSRMFNFDKDILSIHWHPSQNAVPNHELLWYLEMETINRVSEVGVDINAIVDYPFRSGPLQFVSGLGRRKANSIMQCIRNTNQHLESRVKLIQVAFVGPKVFMNAAGFIIIDPSRVEDPDAYIEALDSSRVHPESYEIARKMAADALEVDENYNAYHAVEEVLNDPSRLKVLDLDAFASEMDNRGFGVKNITLYDIRAELSCRYKDLRDPYTPPTKEEMFKMLSPDSEKVFSVGKLVQGEVKGLIHGRKPDNEDAQPELDRETGNWKCNLCKKEDFTDIQDVYAHCSDDCPGPAIGYRIRLENGMNGMVHCKQLSDRFEEIKDRWHKLLKFGQMVTFKIMKIDFNRWKCDLTCKGSELQKEEGSHGALDRYFDEDKCNMDQRKKEHQRVRREPTNFVKRVVTHPSFHNITFKDAEKMLAKMEQGEAIIRPSSSSADNLVVTWKVTDDVYQHINIREGKKKHHFNIGEILYIDGEVSFAHFVGCNSFYFLVIRRLGRNSGQTYSTVGC